jgi:uncharacterized Zn-binding protein involved in type VI secretion
MAQPAARVADFHTCPMITPGTPPVPHAGGPVLPPGAITVLIGGQPAATFGDMCTCIGPPDSIVQGSASVLIYGRPAARMGDMTAHGGAITVGCMSVLIGGPTFTTPSVPVTVEDQSWWNPSDWWDQIMGNPPDVYFGNIVIRGDAAYQARVLADLQALDQTRSGRRLLNSLNNSGRTVTIENYPNTKEPNATTSYEESATRQSDGSPGTPADVEIHYNPTIDKLDPQNPNAPDWTEGPAPIWLAHELVHADHQTHGTSDSLTGKQSKNDGLTTDMHNEELNTAGIPPYEGHTDGSDSGVTENDIRRDWPSPLPQRPHY